ncbi:NAD/NADP-dependent octopine/nopaline dehydrogenase family protein [Anaeromicrobium sediminis]|uniref:NADP transhydrogenase subunit alpha n=1 Tax=Anaeromicrobium sediminis TaxID=1478221 RepID=A0A267ML13_9FIRM|nr:NAD/NADP-dependent octopine/nopaline dehydrogenase family protein [Anaeromicrobium sediminis]PAB59608.1 NADP transhydrogenase subunit alpha [Anaeromicrobium sediminis]
MKVAVIGAGNGGISMAAHMALKGNEVSIYSKFNNEMKEIIDKGGIYLKNGCVEGFAKMKLASTEISKVIKDAELIMVVAPAFAHKDIANEIAPHLEDSQIVILNPGRTGGALQFRKIVKEKNKNLESIVIGEAQTLIYASRKVGPAEATIFGIKEKVSFAVLPSSAIDVAKEKIQKIFPQFTPLENILETSLLNIGAIFHPAPCIFNAARIESTKGNFEYYHEGITPTLGKILEKIDEERMNVAKGLGVKNKSTIEWLKDAYGVEGNSIYECIQKNKSYSGIKAPSNINTRYISEDVPMSLVPIAEFGQLVDVETPTIDMIINLANIIHDKDYRENGRKLEDMGILKEEFINDEAAASKFVF